jgi:hypothetical protein
MTNEPAFPRSVPGDTEHFGQVGMTLRDYFASKAMQVLISMDLSKFDWIPEQAYRYADAMLKARLQ